MSLCPPCPVIDCPLDDPFALYTLQEETFPFVLNCPPGYDCAPVPGSDISMVCCDDFMVTRTLPTALTQDIYNTILTGMIQECQTHQPFCGGPQVFSLYWNSPQSCTKYCPDGNPFTYTVPSGVVLAPTILQANQAAAARACSLAISKRICLGSLNQICCINEVFSAKITASGGGLAHSPSTNNWTISAGSLPTGLTFNGGDILGTFATITGTPTVAGTYGFTVKVMAPDGQYQTKNYTIGVLQMQPTTLPDATYGDAYFQALTCAGLPPDRTVTFSLSSGALPTGMSLSSDGHIAGTPTAGLPASFGVTVTTDNGVSCTQSFTLSEASISPFAYYKFDTITGAPGSNTTPDSMPLALNMNNSNATATAVAGKISSGWTWFGSAGVLAGGAPFNFTGKSFLIRFWARVIGTPASWGVNFWNIVSDGSLYRVQVSPLASGGAFKVRFTALNPGLTYQSTGVLDATWRRVVCYYNLASNSMSIVIDNGAADTNVVAGAMGAGASRFDCAGIVGGICEIDELGFWSGTDAEWSAAQFLSDWNGGTGKTYP